MTLTLHPEKGLNPRLTFCPRCGNDTDEIILLGASKAFGDVADYERIPALEFCNTCKEELALFEAEVAKGGVYWRCSTCRNSGVFTSDSLIAKKVRDISGIKSPKPCGIDFTNDRKDLCPVCAKNIKGENDAD